MEGPGETEKNSLHPTRQQCSVLLEVLEDIEMKWSLFRTELISSAVESCARNKTDYHLIYNLGISRRKNLQLRQKKGPKNAFGRNLVVGRIPINVHHKQSIFADYSPLAWKKSLSTTTSIKDLTGKILRIEKEIHSRWRKYFEDLFNPVRETPTDTCDSIDFGTE